MHKQKRKYFGSSRAYEGSVEGKNPRGGRKRGKCYNGIHVSRSGRERKVQQTEPPAEEQKAMEEESADRKRCKK